MADATRTVFTNQNLKNATYVGSPGTVTSVPSVWVTYRSKLRQVPETQTDPFNIVWPEAPQ